MIKPPNLDKTVVSLAALEDSKEDDVFWKSKCFEERLNGVEINRRLVYGIGATSRFQRLLEIAELTRSQIGGTRSASMVIPAQLRIWISD